MQIINLKTFIQVNVKQAMKAQFVMYVQKVMGKLIKTAVLNVVPIYI